MNRPIWVIEDNRDSRTVYEINFRNGYLQNPVIMLDSGRAALDYLATAFENPPIVIILNEGLIDVKADEVLRVIRATPLTANCRVALLRGEDLIAGIDSPTMQPLTIVRKQDNAMAFERFLRAVVDLHGGFVITEQEG